MSSPDILSNEMGEIENYFAGKTIFLTGSTGFLGKLLVEKLLRSCHGIERIYILVREKKGKEPHERVKELFDAPIFDRLKRSRADYADKISLWIGDCLLPDLGLSEEDRNVLRNDVNCVLHCAATVRFDASLRKAAYINVRAVRDLLKIARDMKQLTSFVHVSTAFSHCPRKDIDEVFYETTMTAQKLLSLVEALDDDVLEAITPTIINKWPNTYSFTKAIAEGLVKAEGNRLPLSVVRPSIIVSTSEEPMPGWIDNVYGPTGIFLAVALGAMRTLHCDKNKTADLVPADYVVNAIIASAWNVGTSQTKQIPTVYNYVSGSQNSLKWSRFMRLVQDYALMIPSPLVVYHYILYLNKNLFVHLLFAFLLHTVPAYVVDFVLFCIGKKPMLVDGYRKIAKFSGVISYFATQEWNFHDTNIQNLWDKLNARDRQLFEFDIRRLNWDDYFRTYVKGCRIYLLKDPLDTIPRGRKKLLALKIAHYSLLSVLALFLYYLLKFSFAIVF